MCSQDRQIMIWTLKPSSIYSWSIGHILEQEFFWLGRLSSQGSKEQKVGIKNSEQLMRVDFKLLVVQKNFKFFFKNIVSSANKMK